MDIEVRANFPRGGFGFDGVSRRKHNQTFMIDETLFDESWMVRVESKPKPKAKAKAKAKDE